MMNDKKKQPFMAFGVNFIGCNMHDVNITNNYGTEAESQSSADNGKEDATSEQDPDERKDAAEVVEYEEVTHSASKAIAAASSVTDADRKQALREYVGQLSGLVTPAFKPKWAKIVDDIVKNDEVSKWLLQVRKDSQFVLFNKGRVYKMALMLKNQNVIYFEKALDVKTTLDNAEIDGSYDKSMTTKTKESSKIESVLAAIAKKK